ncbi:hypothetical protein BJX64DRAFT_281431 [Aspergillus heterothallicus]
MSDILARLSEVASRPTIATDAAHKAYDCQIRELLLYLKQPGLIPSTSDPNEYLESLSPSEHSLSFLYVLRHEIQQAQKRAKRDIPDALQPGGGLWKWAVKFLRLFDPIQIRYATYEWRQLVELVASAAVSCSKTLLALKVTRDALDRLAPSGIFTSTHLLLVKLALLSSSYTYALSVTDQLLYYFPTDTAHVLHEHLLCSDSVPNTALVTDASGISSKLSYRDHLQYFLYSAMIYMALKKWNQASHCLNAVISSPTANTVSKIMVEAYKKWVLANLLGSGKIPSGSKMIAPHVSRVYQSLARPYLSLAEAFERGDLKRMGTEIELGQHIWQADTNTGLVCQLFTAYDKFMIMKLGRTFSALTMADVLKRTLSSPRSSHDAEDFVASLIMSNALSATLSQSNHDSGATMLRLSLGPESHELREELIRAKLIRARTALTFVARGVTQTDQTLEISQENLQFLGRSQKWSANPEKLGSYGEAGGGDMDEDLMGDGQ